jgi:hypothetical protein
MCAASGSALLIDAIRVSTEQHTGGNPLAVAAAIGMLVTMLALRPTVINGSRYADDHAVIWTTEAFGTHRVGRIRLAGDRTSPAWLWSINPPIPVPAWVRGTAPTLDDAKAAFREAFHQFAAQTTVEQWRRCFETQGA